ncbi:MAG TPA: hypothetical protein VL495_03585 [Edaphobacter sp.]|jgi:hypothetical protein|nr:hypothetical protein [Edaphobacter sp.]
MPDVVNDSPKPLQVSLLMPLDVGKVMDGAPILAKSLVNWREGECSIVPGAVISGHLAHVQRKSPQDKTSHVEVVFDSADCSGRSMPIALTLYAVIVIREGSPGTTVGDYGMFGSGSPSVLYGPVAGSYGTISGAAQMASMDTRYATYDTVQSEANRGKLPSVIKSGQVFGKSHLSLAVDKGEEGGSVLSYEKGNLRLEAKTEFVLIAKPVAPTPETNTNLSAAQSVVESKSPSLPHHDVDTKEVGTTQEVAEIDKTELCSSSCGVIDNNAPSEVHEAPMASVGFGYVPREKGERASLSYEAAIVFLDAKTLLFTFEPRQLLHHLREGQNIETEKTIHAVLIDVQTHAPIRIMDWRVRGEGQYLWRAGPGRILVRRSDRLYLMDASLNDLRSIPLRGPLAFVSVAPSGKRIAVGTQRERYTPKQYAQIFEATHISPEEDVDVQLLNEQLEVLAATRQDSTAAVPILSDQGELRLSSVGRYRWQISLLGWEGERHKIATIHSVCLPELSAPSPEALFLVGCESSLASRWYRVIRYDGTAILTSRGSSLQIGHESLSASGSGISIRVIHLMRSQLKSASFVASELVDQEVAVYSSSEGKRLFRIRARPALVHQSFAVSPSDDLIAVLADGKVWFYPFTPNAQQ